MAEKKKSPIKIVLTPEQKEHIKETTGKEVEVLELSPEELEQRVAPASFLATCSGKKDL